MDASTLESMPLERLEAEITELAGHLAAGECRWLLYLAEYDRREGWREWDCRTCAFWLSWKCGVDLRTAQDKLRVARALEDLPRVRAEFAAGRLSYSKVRALVRIATPESEEGLVGMALGGTAAHVASIARGYKKVERYEERHEDGIDPSEWRTLRLTEEDDLATLLVARLTAEEGELVRTALAAAGEGRSQVDALVLMAESFLTNGEGCRRGTERTMVKVNVDASVLLGSDDGIAQIEGGAAIPPETARRMACDASFVWLLRGADGEPKNVSDRRGGIPQSLRRLVASRDRGLCRFPGCGEQRFTDVHHIRHREHGGKHTADNLITLCWFHHRLVHEGGWTLAFGCSEDGPAGELLAITPDGNRLPMAPPHDVDVADGGIERRNWEQGIEIDATTAIPQWYGDRLDLGWAVTWAWHASHPTAVPRAV